MFSSPSRSFVCVFVCASERRLWDDEEGIERRRRQSKSVCPLALLSSPLLPLLPVTICFYYYSPTAATAATAATASTAAVAVGSLLHNNPHSFISSSRTHLRFELKSVGGGGVGG